MTAGTKQRPRLGTEGAANVNAGGGDKVTIQRDPTHASLRGFWWRNELPNRRRVSRLLDEVLERQTETYDPASDFGLSVEELRAEAKRRAVDGWQSWEIRDRFVKP